MPRVTCRCGESLDYDLYGPERIVCGRCGSKVRIRRREPGAPGSRPRPDVIALDDGYVRFRCPCGRRLKIRAKDRPEAGRCPDCGRVVPVPDSAWISHERRPGVGLPDPDEQRTDELSPEDVARINTWSRQWQLRGQSAPPPVPGDRPDEGATPAAGAPIVGAGIGIAARPSAIKMEAGLRVCPRCGKPVHLGASNCRECGASVPKR
jgi:hypothetical protein